MTIKVRNNSDIDLHDRYNGTDYSFPKGKSVIVEDEVARHVFGFGDAEKAHYLTRLGWMKTNLEYDQAMKRLGQFTFSDASVPDADEIQPKQEQGLAPLQVGAEEETSTDGEVESSVPIPPKGAAKKRSILSQLSGAINDMAS